MVLLAIFVAYTLVLSCYGKSNSQKLHLLWSTVKGNEQSVRNQTHPLEQFDSKWGKYRQCLLKHCISLNKDNDEEVLPFQYNCDHRQGLSRQENDPAKESSISLYFCLLEVSHEHNRRLISMRRNPSTVHGPQLPLISLLTYLTKDIVDYTVYSIAVNLAFAIYHNHLLYVIDNFHTNRCHAYNATNEDEQLSIGESLSTKNNIVHKYCGTFFSMSNTRSAASVEQNEIDLLVDSYDSRWSKVGLLLMMANADEVAMNGSIWEVSQSDYFMWLDADLIILNLIHLRLQDLITDHPKAHIFASAEHAGSTTMINSGSLLIKNSQWSRTFLQQWWEIQDRRLLSDQEQFDLLYQHLLSNGESSGVMEQQRRSYLEEKIKILPPYALNSDPPAMTKQQPHHPVLHLMGEEKDFRIRTLSTATAHILEHLEFINFQINHDLVKPLHSLHPQLTLTQKNLLLWTIEEYSGVSGMICNDNRHGQCKQDTNSVLGDPYRILKLFAEYKSLAINGLADVESGRYLSNVIHHFAFAMEYLHSPSSSSLTANSKSLVVNSFVSLLGKSVDSNVTIEKLKKQFPLFKVQAMRIQVYRLLRLNVQRLQDRLNHEKRWKLERGEPFRYPRDYPELVKSVAIAGQQLLALEFAPQEHLDTESATFNKVDIALEIEELLQEMLQTANEKQHDAIYHMIAHHKIQQCMMSMDTMMMLEEGSDAKTSMAMRALSHCQGGVEVFQRLVHVSGQHILVNPLMLTANLLSTLQRFSEAYKYYEIALTIVKSSDYSSVHDPLSIVIPLLLNYGTALVQGLHDLHLFDRVLKKEDHQLKTKLILEEGRHVILQYRSVTKDPRELQLLESYLNRIESYLEQSRL